MATGLIVPVSGPYLGSWKAYPIGTLNDDGYVLQATLAGQEVNLSDAYGMTLVEAIYRGQNWRIRLRGLEANKTGLLSILQEFGNTTAVGAGATDLNPHLGLIGTRWTSYNDTLLLTAILGNPPTMPATLTASNSGFAPNTNTEMLMTSKVREMPLELVLLPYTHVVASTTYNVPFSTT